MSNEWFERVWIIQELAVAKAQVIQYGDQEIDWKSIFDALARVMMCGFGKYRRLTALLDRREFLSALVMEEVRSNIEAVDLVQLKDTLKLTLGFKATLPIHKVYALLGLLDERRTPLFHPRFGIENRNIVNHRTAYKDTVQILKLIGEITDAASGRSNSRRARAILSSGTSNALRYIALLTRDLERMNKKLENLGAMKEGGSGQR